MWFDKRRIEREERQLERTHQREMLVHVLTSLEAMQESSRKQRVADADALVAVAKGITAQATAFGEWIKSFQTTVVPTSSVVREEDEYREEQERLMALGLPGELVDLPDEFKLAYVLRNDPNLVDAVMKP